MDQSGKICSGDVSTHSKTKCLHCNKMISTRNISTHYKTCKVKKINETDQSLGTLLEKLKSMEGELTMVNQSLYEHKMTVVAKDMQISTLQNTIDKLLQHVVIIKKETGTLEVC